jgi:hypothetical protein
MKSLVGQIFVVALNPLLPVFTIKLQLDVTGGISMKVALQVILTVLQWPC